MVKRSAASFVSENKQKGCLFLFTRNCRGFVFADSQSLEAAVPRIPLRSSSGSLRAPQIFIPSLYHAQAIQTDVGSRKSKILGIRILFYLALY